MAATVVGSSVTVVHCMFCVVGHSGQVWVVGHSGQVWVVGHAGQVWVVGHAGQVCVVAQGSQVTAGGQVVGVSVVGHAGHSVVVTVVGGARVGQSFSIFTIGSDTSIVPPPAY